MYAIYWNFMDSLGQEWNRQASKIDESTRLSRAGENDIGDDDKANEK